MAKIKIIKAKPSKFDVPVREELLKINGSNTFLIRGSASKRIIPEDLEHQATSIPGVKCASCNDYNPDLMGDRISLTLTGKIRFRDFIEAMNSRGYKLIGTQDVSKTRPYQ